VTRSVWFANQLGQDSCATVTMLNILFNCEEIEFGSELQCFKKETESLDPLVMHLSLVILSVLIVCMKMKGLAITNMAFLRNIHNSLSR
jgi:ubiquitin carboxyl-terminal hydrolase L5